MPPLSAHQSSQFVKMLLLGESGSGKTGALVSLVKAGYNPIGILDFDNGLDILRNLVLRECPDQADHVFFQTVTDKVKTVGSNVVYDGTPTAFNRAMSLLDNWKIKDGEDLGPPAKWGPNGLLVVDSLSFASRSAFAFSLAMAGRLPPSAPWPQDYGDAQGRIRFLLQELYAENFRCNVIVTDHIDYQEFNAMGTFATVMETKDTPQQEKVAYTRGLPKAIGKALGPEIGRYFNCAVMMKTVGQGNMARKKVRTVSEGVVELKAPLHPKDLELELPIETGLATLFEKIKGQPNQKEAAA